MTANPSLTVAVTGPTGDIGRAFLRALDTQPRVARVLGMARRPFDPAALGLTKTEYRQGDILDRGAVERFVAEADVVVHLAFIIVGGLREAHRVNLEGSRTVFAAAAAAPNAKRFVYTSSVAAYGFHADNPQPLTEDVEPRGTDAHYYSAQKAELEGALRDAFAASEQEVYVLRPCVVAGPDALAMIREIPYIKAAEKVPVPVKRAIDRVPIVAPVIPDPGMPLQLVHHDDVADALVAAVLGEGQPGVYNIAAEGELTLSDIAHELGWHAVPVPSAAVRATSQAVERLPLLPAQAQWIHVARAPVVMDTSRARTELGWKPRHDARSVLHDTVAAARAGGLV